MQPRASINETVGCMADDQMSTESSEEAQERVRALRERRHDQAQVFRRRRLVALALLLAALVLLLRAVLDDLNNPPPVTQTSAPAELASDGTGAGAPSPPEPTTITVAAAGDLLIHEPVAARALENGGGERHDFEPMLARVEPVISEADLAICQMETPMTRAPPTGFPVFNAPPELAEAVAASGFDACGTASNHSLDQGLEGIEETNRTLARAGLEHAGTSASRGESERTTMLEAADVQVAFLSYTEMTNGIPLPEPWSVNLTEPREILADARRAREAGAEVVIVNLHAGEEYSPSPSASQRKLARTLTRSEDVTAIVGQHVHVPQPIDAVNGKVVVYGEGNLLSNQTAACCPEASQDGYIALLDIEVSEDAARVERARYVPVHVRHPDYVVLPVGEAIEDEGADRAALAASYERTRDVVGAGPRIEPVPARLPRAATG